MTNADKYLRDGVEPIDIDNAYTKYLKKCGEKNVSNKLGLFLLEKVKPTLTEDERVILRNIKDHPKYIARQKGYGLMAYDEAKRDGKTGWSYDNGSVLSSFNHLFQFIKERRRICN